MLKLMVDEGVECVRDAVFVGGRGDDVGGFLYAGPGVGHRDAEARVANHARVVGSVADRHDVLRLNVETRSDGLKGGGFVEATFHDLQHGIIGNGDSYLIKKVFLHQFRERRHVLGVGLDHEFGDGDIKKGWQGADAVGVKRAAGVGNQIRVVRVGVPFVENFNVNSAAGLNLAGGGNDPLNKFRRHGMVSQMSRGGQIVRQGAVVVNGGRGEIKLLMKGTNRTRRSSGGENHMDALLNAIANGGHGGRGERFVRRKGRAIKIKGDELDGVGVSSDEGFKGG